MRRNDYFLRLKRDLWEAIQLHAENYPGLSATDYARTLIYDGLAGKTTTGRKKKINKKPILRKVLYKDINDTSYGWIEETNKKDWDWINYIVRTDMKATHPEAALILDEMTVPIDSEITEELEAYAENLYDMWHEWLKKRDKRYDSQTRKDQLNALNQG